jgi:hypothetical protein
LSEEGSIVSSGVTDTYADDKRVLVASFDTLGGANLTQAQAKVGKAE